MVVGYAIPGWRLLLFVLRRRLPALRAALLAAGLTVALAFPLHVAPPRTFTVTASVSGASSAPIAAIEVFAGGCLYAEAPPSPAGDATFVLPAGDYAVSARTTAGGEADGWAMDVVALHLDRDAHVAIGHEMALPSDLYSMRAAPPAPCRPGSP